MLHIGFFDMKQMSTFFISAESDTFKECLENFLSKIKTYTFPLSDKKKFSD